MDYDSRYPILETLSYTSNQRKPDPLFPGRFPSRLANIATTLLILLIALMAESVGAQAPGLLWTTPVGARLFAVDEQTNVYANAGGTVIRLNNAGIPLQTNAICPVPSIAQRDLAGNYYFGGSFDGTQNFGGITLVGGWTNGPNPSGYNPGYPTCFLAKYGSDGSLQRVTSFGAQAIRNDLTSLLLDLGGGCYVGYTPIGGNDLGRVAHFSNSGAKEWEQPLGTALPGSARVKLGGLTPTNCSFFRFDGSGGANVVNGRIDLSGNRTLSGGPVPPLIYVDLICTNAKPVVDNEGQMFQVGKCLTGSCQSQQVLRKYAVNGSEVWSVYLSAEIQWTLARDSQANVYLAGAAGLLAKHDVDGTLIWSTNFGQICVAMIVDAGGNRFVSFLNGAVARLANDPAPELPMISTGPQSQTAFTGDNVTLSVAATGTSPLHYFWYRDGTNVAAAINTDLIYSNATATQSGSYTVVITNVAGAVTSAPAILRVKRVQFYSGNQMLTNGTYVFALDPTFTVRSAFTNGSIFYTTDGSAPSFASTFYSGPFQLSHSATLRAIGYSSDFFQSEEADAVNVVVLVQHTLMATSAGGGSINLNPPGGTYSSTNTVAATATPSTGYSFLYWLDDASGINPIINVSMERNKTIRAVFGTTLSNTVAGSGQVLLDPPGGLYPYGTTVRLTGLPQPGNYFGFWGGAATGNTNPLYFTVSSANPIISSIFGSVPAGQAALTVQINGHGRVDVSPRANVYPLNQLVTLTAIPDQGQTFLNWSSDATGSQNPLAISMTQNKIVTANFSRNPSLRTVAQGAEKLTSEGFRFNLISDSQSVFQILASTNLNTWQYIGTVTNIFGEMQITDPTSTNSPKKFYKVTQ